MLKESNTDSCSSDSNVTTSTNRVSMKQSNTFPFRLHEMLEVVEKEGSESIVSWCAGNHTAFKVHKPQEFVKVIMPRFFQQTKYKSFQRQCNLWGYERILHGPDKGGYEHPEGLFSRGNLPLVNRMVRRKIKRPPSFHRTDGTHASSSSLEAINSDPVEMTVTPSVLPHARAIAADQRRPSVVSCSSSSSCVATTPPHSQGNCYAESSAIILVPNTPQVSSYCGSSVEASPCVDVPEGLYLSPPSTSSQHDAPEAAVVDSDVVAAAADTLFFEGLSAFFDDVDDEAFSIDPSCLMDTRVPQPPQHQYPSASLRHQQQQLLQPKRRLSVELFMASRQQNSNELFFDLLSESDALQKSLEMELMCPLSSV
jgi:hypothetical protein